MTWFDSLLIILAAAIFCFWLVAVSGAMQRFAGSTCSHLGSEWVLRAEGGENFCRNLSTGEVK